MISLSTPRGVKLKTIAMALLVIGAMNGSCRAQNSTGRLEIATNSAHEVIATAIGEVARCGLTALPDAPTFRVVGQVVEIRQSVAGIACRADVAPGSVQSYHVTVNLGHLPPGTYTVNWSFPKLSATYSVAP